MDGKTETNLLQDLDYPEIFRAIPELYLLVSADSQATILDASHSYSSTVGVSRVQLVDRSLFELFPGEPLRASIEKVLLTKQADQMPIQKYVAPGAAQRAEFDSKYWTTVHTPVFDRRGHLKCILHHIEKAAIQSRDDFLSVASHELKTPLTSLMLRLQLVQRKIDVQKNLAPNPAALKEGLDVCIQQAKRLTGLIEEIMSVASIQSGKITYRFERTDLLQLVKNEVREYADQLARANCTVEIVSDDPNATSVWAICDSFRMEQVILNLLSNSVKYGAGKPIRIRVGTVNDELHPDGEAFIEVSDEGLGIPAEKQETIFERFERAIDKNEVSGLGIGLFIAKEIVIAHQGQIKVKSEVGKGSTFTVLFPVVPLPDALS